MLQEVAKAAGATSIPKQTLYMMAGQVSESMPEMDELE